MIPTKTLCQAWFKDSIIENLWNQSSVKKPCIYPGFEVFILKYPGMIPFFGENILIECIFTNMD
jgi:hypothetical protein